MKIKIRSKINQSSFFSLLCLSGALASFPAFAELDLTGIYSGLMFSDSKDEFEATFGGTTKENRGHIKAKVGKILNENFTIEGQFGMTTNSGSSQGIATYGAYLRGGKDFGQYKLYGLLGFSGVHAYQDNVSDVTESSGSYGAGLEIFGNKHIAISLEYIRMIDTSVDGGDFTFDTIGAGFTYYFIEDKSYFNKNRNKIRSIRY